MSGIRICSVLIRLTFRAMSVVLRGAPNERPLSRLDCGCRQMTMPDQIRDRIRLAEAMGWVWKPVTVCDVSTGLWVPPNGQVGTIVLVDHSVPPPFNPFKDANDDYAVLEWMQTDWENNGKRRAGWSDFKQLLIEGERDKTWHYRVGDYARDVLKILPVEDTND